VATLQEIRESWTVRDLFDMFDAMTIKATAESPDEDG